MKTCCGSLDSSSRLPEDGEQIRDAVRQLYGAAATEAASNHSSSCCGAKAKTLNGQIKDVITGELYSADQLSDVPVKAQLASLGCGNPTALAELKQGDVVLDLGSGGGIDVLLSARRVGADGFAYGLDMTDEMLALAERNLTDSGLQNVKFLKGEIESIPLPDSSVNVVISNCVINLSADKDKVLREAARVLKSGGRFAVADIVIDGDDELPRAVRKNLLAWSGCIAKALTNSEYLSKLSAAGFSSPSIEVTRRYSLADIASAGFSDVLEGLTSEQKQNLDGRITSAFVRAIKV